MRKIVLVSCVSKKNRGPHKAGKNYWQEIIASGKVRKYERPYWDNNLKGIGYILKFLNDTLK